jgi:hypothetical protein
LEDNSNGDCNDVLMQLISNGCRGPQQRPENNSMSSFNGVDSLTLGCFEEGPKKDLDRHRCKPPQLRMSSHGSSTHSTSRLSDSMTSNLDLEYGCNETETTKQPKSLNKKKIYSVDFNGSMSDWNSELETLGCKTRQELLNASFGELTKTTSDRNFNCPKPARQRRMSVHGYTPSQSMERRTSFRSTYKATVDDWNSELPVDSDDEIAPNKRFSKSTKNENIEHQSVDKEKKSSTPDKSTNIIAPEVNVTSEVSRPVRNPGRSSPRRCVTKHNSALDVQSEKSNGSFKFSLSPTLSTRRLKASSIGSEHDITLTNVLGETTVDKVDRHDKIEQLSSPRAVKVVQGVDEKSCTTTRLARSVVRNIRGGISFRSELGTTSAHGGASKLNTHKKSVLVEGKSCDIPLDQPTKKTSSGRGLLFSRSPSKGR